MGVLVRRRRRRRRDQPRASQTVIRGLICVAIFGVVGFLMLRLYDGVPTKDYARYYVSTPTVGNLLAHDAVRVSGKRIGQVLELEVGEDGRPRVELQLDPGTKLRRGTQVRIRANGLLGARYVELVPGRDRRLLDEGATIRGTQSSYTYGLPEAVDTFDAESRGGLRATVGGLGEGLADNGAGLNASVHDLGEHTDEFTGLARAILAPKGAAARLLPSFDSAFQALDRTTYAVPAFTEEGSRAVEPFVTEREPTRATIAQAPATLSATDDGLRRARKLLTSVRSLSTAADGTLEPAPQGFLQLAILLREAKRPVREADPFLKQLTPGARGAVRVLTKLDPALPQIKEAADLARPFLGYVGDYGCDVVNAGAVLRSMTGYGQSGSGPNGPRMAFRLEVVPASPLETVGIEDKLGIYKRDSYSEPCKYVSRPYPPLTPDLVTRSKDR